MGLPRILALAALAGLVLAAGLPAAQAVPRSADQESADARGLLPHMCPGAEDAAMHLLEAMKTGDAGTFLRLLDLRALYRDVMRDADEKSTFWQFVRNIRRAVHAEFDDGPAEGFQYEIISSESRGSEAAVMVAFKPEKDAEWQEQQLAFAPKDGQWKITTEGMKTLDFGFGPRGPISRQASAVKALEKMLEATKKGDADTILNYLDLKGIYESIPNEVRPKDYEKWEKQVREEMKKEIHPNADFEYEILSAEEKGDKATMKVKVKEAEDTEWEEKTVILEKIAGKWKITLEGIEAMGE